MSTSGSGTSTGSLTLHTQDSNFEIWYSSNPVQLRTWWPAETRNMTNEYFFRQYFQQYLHRDTHTCAFFAGPSGLDWNYPGWVPGVRFGSGEVLRGIFWPHRRVSSAAQTVSTERQENNICTRLRTKFDIVYLSSGVLFATVLLISDNASNVVDLCTSRTGAEAGLGICSSNHGPQMQAE